MATQHVTVSGRNMECGEALTRLVEEQAQTLCRKYFNHIVTWRVVFEKHSRGLGFSCGIQVLVGHDMYYAGAGRAHDVHSALYEALEHVSKQLRRKKRELREDKPERPKDVVLNELDKLEPAPRDQVVVLPIRGEDLSISDQGADEGARFVHAQYKAAE